MENVAKTSATVLGSNLVLNDDDGDGDHDVADFYQHFQKIKSPEV